MLVCIALYVILGVKSGHGWLRKFLTYANRVRSTQCKEVLTYVCNERIQLNKDLVKSDLTSSEVDQESGLIVFVSGSPKFDVYGSGSIPGPGQKNIKLI